MSKLNYIYLGLSLIIINIYCATTAPIINLSPSADKVKIFRMNDPPITCKEIKPIEVIDGEGCGLFGYAGTYENAYNRFRNKVVELGGNAAQLQTEVPPHMAGDCHVNEYIMRGIAFMCPDSSLK